MTPPNALRNAANLLDELVFGNVDATKLTEAFAEICFVHDTLVDLMRKRPDFREVLRLRGEQLKILGEGGKVP